MAQILLHGTLHVTIFEADSLTTSRRAAATSSEILRKGSTFLKRRFSRGVSLIRKASFCNNIKKFEEAKMRSGGLYATIDVKNARLGRTRIITNESSSPRWYETFHIYCAHMTDDVVFTVKEDIVVGATLLGRAYLPVTSLLSGNEAQQWLPICDNYKKPLSSGARIRVSIRYADVSQDPQWNSGIRLPEFAGVPNTYFPQRENCMITLYQDAHVPNGSDSIALAGGLKYTPARCWEEVFDKITAARHFVYITGWSVYTEMTLVRDPLRPRSGSNATLGELLKKKANEGVRVLVLVWDDRTSVERLKRDGLMATHDQETFDYFNGSNVYCVLCPRNPDDAGSFVQDIQIGTMFTHHQKTVIVDAPVEASVVRNSSNTRRVVAFVGGIDLCDGRYDTPLHSLFRTLGTVHRNDFHQPNFPESSIKKGGPREPWHDIHSKIEGPAAWDVLFNFEQRWRQQSGRPNLLLPLDKLVRDKFFLPSSSPATSPDDTNKWNVQLFRSIDGGAAAGFPTNPEQAAAAGLTSGKDHAIDCSIHKAYVAAIRRAKNFVYIENQYFLGSSYGWRPTDDIKVEDIGALHLIPKELSLKIVSTIEAGERFAVYIVVPMWPEGVPESASVQAILDWQRRTLEMMYADVTLALKAKGIVADPRDYLSFFCLGNREVKHTGEYVPEEKPEPDSDYARAQEARRFMIYVHAKMMIVDDEYIIIGSANINQRSMDGARDSEIAMGAYQPRYVGGWNKRSSQIQGFRLSLWREHAGVLENTFLEPESLNCIRRVNQIAEMHWNMYASGTFDRDLPGHLMTYPVEVTVDGEVRQRPGVEFFPDTKAKVLGTKSDYLPPILTT